MAESADIIARDAQVAARFDADVGREQIGEIYAKALLGAAEKAGETASVLEEFDALIRDVLDRFPKLEAVLASLVVSHDEKVVVLDRVFGGRLSAQLLRFLKVVSRHGRLDCLRAIQRRARRLYETSRGRIRVRLTTPTPLSQLQILHIAESLRATLGGEPVLETAVDAELIGGAVLRIGDTVYDGSIARQLQAVRQQMIDRSIHEIQSRRNRFRNSARD